MKDFQIIFWQTTSLMIVFAIILRFDVLGSGIGVMALYTAIWLLSIAFLWALKYWMFKKYALPNSIDNLLDQT